MVKSTRGPVIEFGCGDGSTALLHEICKESGRILVSLDDDLKWLDKSRKKYFLYKSKVKGIQTQYDNGSVNVELILNCEN